MPYLGIFGLDFIKTNVILKISTMKFVKLSSFAKKQNTLNLGLQMPDFGIFGLDF